MVTQCEAQGKKNNGINLYAGIFDNKLFRRGGKGSHWGSKSDSEKCRDDVLTYDRSRPVYLTEDAVRDNYATSASKHHLASCVDISSKRNCQPLASYGEGSLQCRAGELSKCLCKGDAELEDIPDVCAGEFDEHEKGTLSVAEEGGIHAGKRCWENGAALDKFNYMCSHNNADHKWQESKVSLYGRRSEFLERKDLRANGPVLKQQELWEDADSSDNIGLVPADSHNFSSVPSTLLSKKGASVGQIDTNVNNLLQFEETSRCIWTAEPPGTISSTSNDEVCRLERKLSFTALTNDHVTTRLEDVGEEHAFSFKRSNVDVITKSIVPNKIEEERTMNSGDDLLSDTLKSQMRENDRHSKHTSKLQAFLPDRTRCSEDRSVPDITKTGKSGEREPYGRSDANGLAWKVSPNRGDPVLASPTRIGETISLDSLSSHGGSSSSGSPLALEALKEGRVSSPGDISMSKGSPYSLSSRSMGSITGYDMAVNALLSPTSSNESPGQQWQLNTRKSDETPLSRVGHRNRGGGISNRMKSDGMNSSFVSTGSLTKGCQSPNANGHANLLPGGNLLVGAANGDVLSYNGGLKGHAKQERTKQWGTVAVDCRLMKRVLATSDSEAIKNAGNEYYKAGHFSEALTLYDKAVALSPSNAVYRCNRAAVLSGLEQLGEAVKECEEAIRLDPSYVRTQQRAASLYVRLGMIESARRHLRDAGQHTDSLEAQQLQVIEKHISRCIEARKLGDWHIVIKESDAAVVAGADSAPQIFGFKAEALLRLQKFHHADSVCNVAQKIESSLMELSIGSPNAYLYLIRAQVNMALGRFDEAVLGAEAGARIEPSNALAATLLRKARTVAQARATGNDFFNAGRLFESLASYTEGLESDPTNAVLLCNRSACRLKLGQWEKAVEDCDAALNVQPNYTKALLRRASCLTKLERWEDALQDYEALKRELPGDPNVHRGLFDVQVAIKKSRGEEIRGMKFGGDVEEVINEQQFQEAVGSAGLSVVQFITRWSDRCQELSPFIDDMCRRHPCGNFVKVDVDELPYLVRTESITFIPTFKIYKDGQKVKELVGPSQESLEYAVRHYSL